jgi:hypothetical protein
MALNIPTVIKRYQIAIKCIKIIHSKAPQNIYKNWDFWYKNIPSGNPDPNVYVNLICLFFLSSSSIFFPIVFTKF